MKSGVATFTNLPGYIAWMESMGLRGWKAIYSIINKTRYGQEWSKSFPDIEKLIVPAFAEQYTVRSWSSYPPTETEEAKWPGVLASTRKKLETVQYMNSEMEQPIHVRFWLSIDDETLGADEKERKEFTDVGVQGMAGIYIGNRDKFLIIVNPDEYMDFTPDADYSDMSPAMLRASIDTPREGDDQQLIPSAAENMTPASVHTALEGEQQHLEELKAQMEAVKNGSAPELKELTEAMEALQRELTEKKEALMAELDRKKEELEEKKYELENQIYLLDSQIYSILCYAGETVKFATIKSGKKAPDTEPIVVYQKLRYLDEDLARMVSLYEIQWNELDMFEEFLRHCPEALEVFAPNERCVMLVRLSKTGTTTGIAQGNSGMNNLLEHYQYYHGKSIGIIIRNRENLYLGWTDDSRIHITDDLLISKSSVKVEEEKPAETRHFDFPGDEERYRKEQTKKYRQERKEVLDGLVSRNFVYQILQGVIDRTPMLPLPKGVTLSRQSEYVVYAVADRWLSDTRFGSMTDIIDRVNRRVTKGDSILTVQHLRPEAGYGARSYVDAPWHNSRGRGERNRTHDTSVDDCTIYQANLVEYEEPAYALTYKLYADPARTKLNDTRYAHSYGCKDDMEKELVRVDGMTFGEAASYGDGREEIPVRFDSEESCLAFCKKNDFGDAVLPICISVKTDRHVFVSVEKKDGWWRNYTSAPRANFELYDNEYINLTYMNSTWLLWAINTKSLGRWCIGGVQVEYAYAIRYLNKALEFVRAREAEEKKLLDAIDQDICKDAEWPLKLTEWKMANRVRAITEYQAKRYAAHTKSYTEIRC